MAAKPTPAKTEIELALVKSTKGTHVYSSEAAGITNLYFPKTLAVFTGGDDAPPTLTMTLS